jgi:bla regulator protein BlaR1
MNILFINNWLTDELFKAFCWTLMHSLWQGLLAAAVAGLIVICTRKSSARLRYNLLGMILLLFLVTSAFTFYRQVTTANRPLQVAELRDAADRGVSESTGEMVVIPVEQVPHFIDQFVIYLNNHAALIVLLWALFFIAKCMKLFTGLLYVHRIRHYKTQAVPESWHQKLKVLTKALDLHKPVRLLQSELVKVPVSVGFLKPVILIPLGLISHLPPDQVETILLHELAHIRRKDYLINLLQSCAETIYFFNPALIWISSLLREEREACCDDMVVACTRHKSSYLEALVSFQEYALSSNGYAMALGGEKNYLLNRVKRLLTRENKKLNVMEKIVLLTGLILITAFSFVPQPKAKALPVPAISQQYTYTKAASTDTVPDRQSKRNDQRFDEVRFTSVKFSPTNEKNAPLQTIVAIDQHGKKYLIKKEQGQITALAIDGNSIPSHELSNYTGLFQRLQQTLDEASANKQKGGQMAKAKQQARAQQDQANVDSLRLQKQRNMQRRYAEQLQRRQEHLIKLDSMRQQKLRYKERLRDSASKQEKIVHTESTNPGAKKQAAISKSGSSETPVLTGSSASKPVKKKSQRFYDEKNQARVRGVMTDLVQEKIVTDVSAVEWFGLREDQLVVNGQKVPDDIHQKLKAKYGIRPNYGLFYGPSQIHGPGIIFDKKDLK